MIQKSPSEIQKDFFIFLGYDAGMECKIMVLFLAVFTCVDLAWAETKPVASASPATLNQVLFYESKDSWTARDFELFEKIKKDFFPSGNLSSFSENNDEDFLLSRLSAREALLFELTPLKFKLSETQRLALSDFSKLEIDEEIKNLGLAAALVELKESQLKQKLRFKTWLDLLKRKYQFKIKSYDFKP